MPLKLLLAYFWPMVILPEPQGTLDEALKRPANLAFVRKHWPVYRRRQLCLTITMGVLSCWDVLAPFVFIPGIAAGHMLIVTMSAVAEAKSRNIPPR